MAQKVIIDADPGIGDAVAIALALFDPDIDVVGITATAGCVSGQAASHNLQAIVEYLDPPKWPRVGCSEAPVPHTQRAFGGEAVSMIDLNGPTGLGDFQFSVADLHHTRDSAKVMIDLVRAEPHEITLLTLGPLTNLELAMDRAPDFLSLIKSIVSLGGSIEIGGDVTATAEFNVFSDPEAARTILRSPATKTLVPLDASSKAVLTFEQFDRMAGRRHSRLARFLGEIVPFALRAHHQHLGLEGMRLHEIVAVAALSRPHLFESRGMALDVETRGELTRGMTVFDRRGIQQWQRNIDVLRHVDTQGVLDYFAEVVGRQGE